MSTDRAQAVMTDLLALRDQADNITKYVVIALVTDEPGAARKAIDAAHTVDLAARPQARKVHSGLQGLHNTEDATTVEVMSQTLGATCSVLDYLVRALEHLDENTAAVETDSADTIN